MTDSNLSRFVPAKLRSAFNALTRATAIAGLCGVLAACTSMGLDSADRAPPKLSSKVAASMSAKGMKPESPVLVRIFKQESELEVWKVDKSGSYALFKTYPMCRWSGKLGPKTKSGDRQAPEGFYHVSAGMLNPNSQYFVSFNLGYPNRLEAALGYTGEALMVHGACSSSGCYAMTDQQIGEIFAIVDRALKGGQNQFQVQAYPFRMTARNMAAYKDDANFPFWKTLKEGYDTFELTKRQPKVSVCGRRYVFNSEFAGGEPSNPLANCPQVINQPEPAIAAKLDAEQQKLAAALNQGTSSAVSSYVDGGMHPSFRAILKNNGAKSMAEKVSGTKYPISRPEAALADPFAGAR
ncbi:L,D-transpeptidase family protein [Agrobacterium rosae]|uniref:L,D-transpeptidase family protein n=1 Tax=Agrobacterium rosae TaxID=1972867 RepID=UPI001FEE11E7|nr:murein L,D-transpeptidase family protein [Agrobacterium rosae]MDX8312389.1 murein L,D-transpeptidase family protein [Agrobacterium rosae]